MALTWITRLGQSINNSLSCGLLISISPLLFSTHWTCCEVWRWRVSHAMTAGWTVLFTFWLVTPAKTFSPAWNCFADTRMAGMVSSALVALSAAEVLMENGGMEGANAKEQPCTTHSVFEKVWKLTSTRGQQSLKREQSEIVWRQSWEKKTQQNQFTFNWLAAFLLQFLTK